MVKNEQEQVSSNFGQGSGEQSGKPAGDDCGAVAGEFTDEGQGVFLYKIQESPAEPYSSVYGKNGCG